MIFIEKTQYGGMFFLNSRNLNPIGQVTCATIQKKFAHDCLRM